MASLTSHVEKQVREIHRLNQAMIQSGSNTTDAQFLPYRMIYSHRENADTFVMTCSCQHAIVVPRPQYLH